MGTQKNCLNETVLSSTQTYVNSDGQENIDNFTLKKFVYLNMCITEFDLYSMHAPRSTQYGLLPWVKVQNYQNPKLSKIKSENLQYAYKYQQFQDLMVNCFCLIQDFYGKSASKS